MVRLACGIGWANSVTEPVRDAWIEPARGPKLRSVTAGGQVQLYASVYTFISIQPWSRVSLCNLCLLLALAIA